MEKYLANSPNPQNKTVGQTQLLLFIQVAVFQSIPTVRGN